jgi:NitT/TauT family transport system substrate-binding protein
MIRRLSSSGDALKHDRHYAARAMNPNSRRTFLRWLVQGTLVATVPSVVAACRTPVPSAPATPTAASARETVHYASDRTFAQSGVYIAAEHGYFAEQNLEVSVDRLTGQELITAITTGQVDVAGGPLGVAHWNAVARGIPLKLVGPMGRQEKGASSTYLMVRKDLIERGLITDYADLVGKRWGVTTPPDYSLARMLAHVGLQPDAVEQVVFGQDFQAISVALSTGAVDAAWIAEPTATLAAKSGAAVKWRELGEVLPGLQNTVVVFGGDLITRRPDVAQRWMTAYLRAVREYHAGIIKSGPSRAEVISILTRWTPVTDSSLYTGMGFPYIDPNGQLNLGSVADQLRFAQDQGQVTASIDAQQAVDTRFAEGAVQRLGRYDA